MPRARPQDGYNPGPNAARRNLNAAPWQRCGPYGTCSLANKPAWNLARGVSTHWIVSLPLPFYPLSVPSSWIVQSTPIYKGKPISRISDDTSVI